MVLYDQFLVLYTRCPCQFTGSGLITETERRSMPGSVICRCRESVLNFVPLDHHIE